MGCFMIVGLYLSEVLSNVHFWLLRKLYVIPFHLLYMLKSELPIIILVLEEAVVLVCASISGKIQRNKRTGYLPVNVVLQVDSL